MPKASTTRKKQITPISAVIAALAILLVAGAAILLSLWPGRAPDPSDVKIALDAALEKNPELQSFVSGYTQVLQYDDSLDLAGECTAGQVPYLMQWDSRWGYCAYGAGVIGYTGCGPTCLSMVLIGLTGDTTLTPGYVAQFASDEGYCVPGDGTSWTLFSRGASDLGVTPRELNLWEDDMKAQLDMGNPIVCVMGPGDFTETGHYIVIHGYDDSGFFVYDPYRRANSEKTWSYDVLSPQIRNLWAFSSAR